MSDERADAIPETAVRSIARHLRGSAASREAEARSILADLRFAGAVPHMAGSEEAKANLERAAREVDALFDGKGPGRWTYAGKRITDDAAEPLLSMHDYLNDLRCHRSAQPDAERAPQPEPRQDEVEAVARALYRRGYGQDVGWESARGGLLEDAEAALDAARRPQAQENR